MSERAIPSVESWAEFRRKIHLAFHEAYSAYDLSLMNEWLYLNKYFNVLLLNAPEAIDRFLAGEAFDDPDAIAQARFYQVSEWIDALN